jgi:hypothetical protein
MLNSERKKLENFEFSLFAQVEAREKKQQQKQEAIEKDAQQKLRGYLV